MSCLNLREKIYLLGYSSNELTGSKLPSNKEVLKVLFFNMRVVKMTLRESARLVVQEVIVFWEKARIPVQDAKHCINKIERLYQKWRGLQKHAGRTTKTHQENEKEFFKTLEALFDIAHAKALELIQIEEDKTFLLQQRQEGRPGFMYGIDYEEVRKQNKREERHIKFLQRKDRCVREAENLKATITLTYESENNASSTADSEESLHEQLAESDHQDVEPESLYEPAPTKKQKRGHIEIITPKLALALDACKISDRYAVHIIAATVESLGHNIDEIILNKNSIHNARKKIRKERAEELRKKMNITELESICLHWDEKLLPALIGTEKVDRLPIIISCGDVEQLLEVPALRSGTGREQAVAIFDAISDWGIQDHVKALVFDTTSVNTGRFNGTCSILENMLERELLYLPCRHHIHEIILKSIFDIKMCKSDGPNVQIFHRFQKFWPNINTKNFRNGLECHKVKTHFCDEDVSQLVNFLNSTMEEKQPREDYRELLELSLIFLGETPNRCGISFRSPGAMHHARWMAKAIYSLKIFLFRFEFELTADELNALRDICIFIVKIYNDVWFSASSAVKSPHQDFKYLYKLDQYKKIDRDISEVALSKFKNYLWYLSSEVVALAFFDSTVLPETKAKMVANLNKEGDSFNFKRASILTENISNIVEKGIEQFISKETNKFFQRFNLDVDFMSTNPSTWPDNPKYLKAQNIFRHLRVVNDTAERGVKLIEDFNKLITKNEEQKQFLLKTVADYRRRFSSSTKECLSQKLL